MPDNFPRGGSDRKGKLKRKGAKEVKGEPDLFSVGTKKDEPANKKVKKLKKTSAGKQGKKSSKKTPDGRSVGVSETQFVSNVAKVETLTLKTIPYGMLLLGVVKDIQDYQLVLSIPNGATATVQITNISDAYKALLQKMTEGDSALLEEGQMLSPLDSLFHVGQPLRCKALDIVSGKKSRLKVTINPKDVNQGIQGVSLKSGMVLSGSVSSQEDHGYIVDIGVPGVSAFLSNKLAHKFLKDTESEPLKIGRYLDCMVLPTNKAEDLLTRNSRIVNVTASPRKVYRSVITENMGLTISMLKPGMLVEGTIQKVSDSGIVVGFLKYKGTIHRSHLVESLPSYSLQDKIRVAVLYINPVTKAVSLTQLVHLVTPDLAPRSLFGEFVYGQVVEEAEVWRCDKKRGVHVNLSDRVPGFARMSALSDKDKSSFHQTFKRGTKHTCRILDFDYCDGVAKVSFKESVIKQQYLKYGDIQPGQVVTCEVKKIHDKGMSVKVSDQIQGFIPTMHLADVPLRNPGKKFQDGKSIKCRVLTVVPEKKKLILTNKKTLVKSKYPVIMSYSQCEVGLVMEGFIADVKDTGVLVVFYNDVKGFVPKSELSTEEIAYPRKLFFEGQVVKCVVMSSDPTKNRLRLSLKVSGRAPFASKAQNLPAGLEIGQMQSCKLTKKTSGGFDILLEPDNVEAFLPTSHLSDHMTLCDLLYEMHQEGEVLPEVMVLSKTNVLVVTNKLSFKKAEKEGLMVKQFSDLKAGLLVPGTVKKIMSYGFFVELCHKLVGLVPTKYICDSQPANPLTLFQPGQSIMVKVSEVDSEKERFLLSSRMSDCYHRDTANTQEILEDYVTQYRRVIESLAKRTGQMAKLASLTLGEIYEVKVTAVSDHGVTCELDSGVKGIVTQENMIGVQCKAGESVEAVLLYIDPTNKCVEMSLSHGLIKAIKHLHNNKFTEAKVEQMLKSEVHLVKPDFVLTILKGHAAGRLAYLPAKKLHNDVLEYRQFHVGQTHSVVIRQVTEAGIYTDLKRQEEETGTTGSSPVKHRHKLKVGDIREAVVKQVYEHQLNISIKDIPGRVHNTEISDTVAQGTDPLKKFKSGDKIKVKVIGFRDATNHQFLPISHPHSSNSLPECTMKESALSVEGAQPCENPESRKLKVGNQVQAFMSNYSHNCLWMQITSAIKGKVYGLNASEDLKVLKDPALHFKTGQCYKATVIGTEKGKPVEMSLIGVPNAVKKNAVVHGFIVSKSEKHGLTLKLCEGYRGTVGLCDLSDEYREQPLGGFTLDQAVKCAVIGCNTQQKNKCLLSLRMSRVCPCKETRGKVTDREIKGVKELKEGEVIRGYVINCDKFGVFVSLGRELTGRVHYGKVSEYYISEPSKVFTPGMLVTVKVLRVDTDTCKVELSLLEADTGVKLDISGCHQTSKRLTEKEKAERPARKRKVSETRKDSSESSSDDKTKNLKKKRKDSVSIATEESDSGVEVKEAESETETTQETAPVGLSSSFSWENTFSLPTVLSDSESDSEDDPIQEEGVKKHKTRQEKKAELKLEEQRLYLREKQLVDTQRTPETEDDFNKMVLKSPDSSLVWLRYMAHHLESSEVDKARAVAERALETISFREEQEKLNMWVAYMNLENMYGTHDSLLKLFDRAVAHNEPLSIYQQLVSIYVKSDKHEAAEQLYNTMMKKFGQNKEVWVNFGLFYFKNNKPDSARKLLQRSFKTLERKQHVDVIAKYAQLEFKFGEAEKGKTMFENLVMSYTKRTDLWSVYIDMMVKTGQTEAARQLFERLIHLSLSAKKMKFCFKKYMDFEQKFGTEERVMAVKQKAIEFVEGKMDD